MSLDGIFLNIIRNELTDELCGCRIEKIHQPQKSDIVFTCKGNSGKKQKLLISCNPSFPRIHLTQQEFTNPDNPPAFCTLLRKHITSGKIIRIAQLGAERMLDIEITAVNELFDTVSLHLIVEIMGRHSNIILTNENKVILGASRMVDFTVSQKRQVLPRLQYQLPPAQNNRLDFLETDMESVKIILKEKIGQSADKAILDIFFGVSPVVCREIAVCALKSTDALIPDDTNALDKLCFQISRVRDFALKKQCLTMAKDPKCGKALEFSFLPLTQYGKNALTSEYNHTGDLLDEYAASKGSLENSNAKTAALIKVLGNMEAKLNKVIALRKQDLLDSRDSKKFKLYGDLLSANLWRVPNGAETAALENYFSEELEIINIPLQPLLTPTKNAQNYYTKYKKRQTAAKHLIKLIENDELELKYIESVLNSLVLATDEDTLLEIQQELIDGNYIKAQNKKRKVKEVAKPFEFTSSDGFKIFVGKNNIQNDKLTTKFAKKDDIWLHTKSIPSSHVIIVTDGKTVPDRTILESAILTAYFSKGRNGSNIEIDYTKVANVKKPKGAKGGMVTYQNYNTAVVTPSYEKISQMLI